MAIIRVLPSRKLKTVVPIPWAEPAAPVAVPPLTAFIRPKQFRNEGLKRKLIQPLTLVEQALFPVQPLPAFKALDQLNNPGLKRKLVPELKLVPPVVIAPEQPLTAFTPVEQLNNPGLKRHLRLVPELDRYAPFVVPEQPPTAYLERPYTIRPSKRRFLVVPETNEFPEFTATPDSVTSVTALIDATGLSAKGIIDQSGLSVTALIFDVFSVSGTIDATGLSVKGIIDSSGLSVTGLI